jgi:hypothetical protein
MGLPKKLNGYSPAIKEIWEQAIAGRAEFPFTDESAAKRYRQLLNGWRACARGEHAAGLLPVEVIDTLRKSEEYMVGIVGSTLMFRRSQAPDFVRQALAEKERAAMRAMEERLFGPSK